MYFFFFHASTESVNAAILSTLFYKYLFPCLPPPLEGELCQAGEWALFILWPQDSQCYTRSYTCVLSELRTYRTSGAWGLCASWEGREQ